MFDNIGEKIKLLAKVICWTGIIFSVIMSIIMFNQISEAYYVEINGYAISGFLWLIIGPLVSWTSSFILYGFGELINNSDIIAHQYKNIPQNDNTEVIKEAAVLVSPTTEKELKNYIAIELEKKIKDKELLDLYWLYKKYVYGYYDKNEAKEALDRVIDKCEKTDFEGNSKLMIEVCKKRLHEIGF